MSVPNFRKSYHTVLGAAIDSHGTRIIIPTITIDQFIVCKYSGCARHVVAENRERIAFIIAKGPHG